MENCPECNEPSYGPHKVEGCTSTTCQDKVCYKCFWGCRYTCPLARLPPPTKLERQLSPGKWESAENFMLEHSEIKEIVIQVIPGEHLYKIIRRPNDFMVRAHYDRSCMKCGEMFIHVDKEPRFFVCPDCLNKK